MNRPQPDRRPAPDALTEDGGADRVAAAVLAVPGVAGLHGGAFGEVATYLPGRRVTGVRIDPVDPRGDPAAGGPGLVEVHVVARYPARVAALADEIRAALAPLVGDRVVDVYVEDYAAPAGDPATDPGPVPPAP